MVSTPDAKPAAALSNAESNVADASRVWEPRAGRGAIWDQSRTLRPSGLGMRVSKRGKGPAFRKPRRGPGRTPRDVLSASYSLAGDMQDRCFPESETDCVSPRPPGELWSPGWPAPPPSSSRGHLL